MSIAGVLSAGVVVAIPVLAINITTKTSDSFDSNKIGVYCEKEWMPAYEKAAEVYNSQSGHKYDVELKEKPSFDALNLIDTLGYLDNKVADIIYMPLDRIPELVQNKQALMGFGTPKELLDGISTDVTGSTPEDIAAYAKKGQAIVKDVNGNNKDYYFAISHATEALVMYVKGWGNDISGKNFMDLVNSANTNQWKNEMVSLQFNNLWSSLGVIAGFIEKEHTGAGLNGQNVGRALCTSNTLPIPEGWKGPYQSNVVKINDPSSTTGMEPLESIPGWTPGGISSTLQETSTALKKACDFISTFYQSTYSLQNKALGGSKTNDWLLGSDFGSTQNDLFKNPEVTKAAVVDGPWAKDNFALDNVNIIPVPALDSNGTPYLQAPGGWMYGINQRNFNNPDKVKDIKAFINILLSNDEVILEEYKYASKIIDGKKASHVLEANTTGFDKQLIEAVAATKKMDARPDGGNVAFGNTWDAWDKNAWSSQQMKDLFKTGTTVDGTSMKNARDILVQSFETMLKGAK